MSDRTYRILIVDDQPTVRQKMGLSIKHLGYESESVENGHQALTALRNSKFDLVLLDIIMPEITGYEVLEQIRSDDILRDIPVLVISSLEDVEAVVKAIELGAEDHIPKNTNPVLLNARIRTCLEKKRVRDIEIEYLRQVSELTAVAESIELNDFDASDLHLESITSREDALGGLARVFSNMAREVYSREQSLKQKIQSLQIQVDEVNQKIQVNSITGTDYFTNLREKAGELRARLETKKQ